MNRLLQIAVADNDVQMRGLYTRAVHSLGHHLVFAGNSGSELIEQCQLRQPDLVILEMDLPDISGLTTAERISDPNPIPIIFVSTRREPTLLERAKSIYVAACLFKPIKQSDLELAIVLAMRHFKRYQGLAEEIVTLRQQIECDDWLQQ